MRVPGDEGSKCWYPAIQTVAEADAPSVRARSLAVESRAEPEVQMPSSHPTVRLGLRCLRRQSRAYLASKHQRLCQMASRLSRKGGYPLHCCVGQVSPAATYRNWLWLALRRWFNILAMPSKSNRLPPKLRGRSPWPRGRPSPGPAVFRVRRTAWLALDRWRWRLLTGRASAWTREIITLRGPSPCGSQSLPTTHESNAGRSGSVPACLPRPGKAHPAASVTALAAPKTRSSSTVSSVLGPGERRGPI
jgi:hypothetical protein